MILPFPFCREFQKKRRIECLRRKTVCNEGIGFGCSKNSRATSVTNNEPALKLIQKPSLTSASHDAREGSDANMMLYYGNSCKQSAANLKTGRIWNISRLRFVWTSGLQLIT